MTLMAAGYYPATYFPEDYYVSMYFGRYGSTNKGFDVFDYVRTVFKVSIVPGYTDQVTGEWMPESITETAINAHVSDTSLEERQTMDPAIVKKGTRKLTCFADTVVNPGDRIKIIEADSSETEWVVNSLMYGSTMMQKYLDISRRTFLLVKI